MYTPVQTHSEKEVTLIQAEKLSSGFALATGRFLGNVFPSSLFELLGEGLREFF